MDISAAFRHLSPSSWSLKRGDREYLRRHWFSHWNAVFARALKLALEEHLLFAGGFLFAQICDTICKIRIEILSIVLSLRQSLDIQSMYEFHGTTFARVASSTFDKSFRCSGLNTRGPHIQLIISVHRFTVYAISGIPVSYSAHLSGACCSNHVWMFMFGLLLAVVAHWHGFVCWRNLEASNVS